MKTLFKTFDLSKSRWAVEEEVNEFLDSIQGKIESIQMQVVVGNDSQYGACQPSLFVLVKYKEGETFKIGDWTGDL